MSLDRIARSATEELVERTSPDTVRRLHDLKRTSRRRTAGRAVLAVTVIAAVVAGGWARWHAGDDGPDPAPPVETRNGKVLVTPGIRSNWAAIGGEVEHLPTDMPRYGELEVMGDGSTVAYQSDDGTLTALDTETGATRELARCPVNACLWSFSPDGTRLAKSTREGLLVTATDGGGGESVAVPVGSWAGRPDWSPDGATIAWSGPDGVYTVAHDGTGLRRIYDFRARRELFLPVAWAPDGESIAFFDTEPHPGGTRGDFRFTLTTVGRDGTGARAVHAAGHCACMGLPAPSLTWSPDGRRIAVAATQDTRPQPGIYTVRPDGSDWTLIAAGYFRGVAWLEHPG